MYRERTNEEVWAVINGQRACEVRSGGKTRDGMVVRDGRLVEETAAICTKYGLL